MHDLIGREIFATGKWNGMEFTEADLDEIVENFARLGEIHHVPLKFGHNKEQPVTDGQPAIGWVSRIFRKGDKLYADFKDMPKSVFESIKNKLYRTVSVELLFDVDHDGNRYKHVLDAVALLGADHPAVNTLADLDALLASRTAFSGGQRLSFETSAGKFKHDKKPSNSEDSLMEDKLTKEFVAEAIETATTALRTDLERVTKERDELKVKDEQHEKDKADFAAKQRTEKIGVARKQVTALLDRSVREQHMTPAMRDIYADQIGVSDDDRVLEIDLDKVRKMCNVEKAAPPDGDEGRRKGTSTDGDPAKDLTTLTYAYMAEHNELNFTRALTFVARAHPDLHREYLDSNGEG
jgi:hypothetical protein